MPANNRFTDDSPFRPPANEEERQWMEKRDEALSPNPPMDMDGRREDSGRV